MAKKITKTPEAEPATDVVYTHPTREQWLNAFVALATPHFAAQGLAMPDKIRVSIGWPSSGIRSKTIGECWIREASGDGHAEIFVTPALKDVERIAGVLTHELVHAVVGHEAKHGPVFKKAATSLGLEGKMTATTEGAAWEAWARPVLAELGPYPGNTLTGSIAGGKKKQKARMLKLQCDTCEIVVRTTKTALRAIADSFDDAAFAHGDDGDDEEGGDFVAPATYAACVNPHCKGHMPFDLNALDDGDDEGEGE